MAVLAVAVAMAAARGGTGGFGHKLVTTDRTTTQ